MKCPPVDRLVYEHMMPRPKPSDPINFNGILTRYLVFEVRQEVHAFYGHLETQEARYPGLDYSNHTHRSRLSRWPWHRRLFRAFDALGLTAAEIAALTKWEGTKWAKERYEKEQKTVIHDSAFDDLPDYREPGSRFRPKHTSKTAHTINCNSTLSEIRAARAANNNNNNNNNEDNQSGRQNSENVPQAAMRSLRATDDRSWTATIVPRLTIDLDENMDDVRADNADDVAGDDDDDSDDGFLSQSVGVQLNERLRERVAAHNAGDTSLPLDEDWEQWLKSAMEAGDWTVVAEQLNRIAAQSPLSGQSSLQDQSPLSPTLPTVGNTETIRPGDLRSIIPQDLLSAARTGHWDHVPGFVQELVRQVLNAEQSSPVAAAQAPAPTTTLHAREPDSLAASWRRYSGLRLPGQ